MDARFGSPSQMANGPAACGLSPERQAAIDHAIEVMAQGLPWGATLQTFSRDEMHER